MVKKYRIIGENIYNFDKKRFMIYRDWDYFSLGDNL